MTTKEIFEKFSEIYPKTDKEAVEVCLEKYQLLKKNKIPFRKAMEDELLSYACCPLCNRFHNEELGEYNCDNCLLCIYAINKGAREGYCGDEFSPYEDMCETESYKPMIDALTEILDDMEG